MNTRLEAFCDGVFAIALTLLIIEFRSPEPDTVAGAGALWAALAHFGPAVFAFLLSFVVILITWINHHTMLNLVHRSSIAFMYANGLLLLTVVSIPFTTSLLGKFILTDAAGPAVALYDAVLALQAAGWIGITATALQGDLARDSAAVAELRKHRASGYGALLLYFVLAILASWLPRTAAIATAFTWLVWLGLSLRAPHRTAMAAQIAA